MPTCCRVCVRHSSRQRKFARILPMFCFLFLFTIGNILARLVRRRFFLCSIPEGKLLPPFAYEYWSLWLTLYSPSFSNTALDSIHVVLTSIPCSFLDMPLVHKVNETFSLLSSFIFLKIFFYTIWCTQIQIHLPNWGEKEEFFFVKLKLFTVRGRQEVRWEIFEKV